MCRKAKQEVKKVVFLVYWRKIYQVYPVPLKQAILENRVINVRYFSQQNRAQQFIVTSGALNEMADPILVPLKMAM